MHLDDEQQLSLLDEDTESRIIANAQKRLLQKQRHLTGGESHPQPPLKDLFDAVTEPDIKPTRRQKKVADTVVEVAAKSAWEEGEIGYLSPIFIQCTLPHSSPKNPDGSPMTRYSRTNGTSTLFIETPDVNRH